MQTIDTIDLIINPFYDLVVHREKNLALIERIKEYAYNNSEPNTIILVSSFDNYRKYLVRDVDEEDEEALIEEHNKLYAEFIAELSQYADHVFMGTDKEFAAYGTDSDFDRMLEKNGLQINPRKLEIYGHGLHREVCIDDAVDSLSLALTTKHEELDIDFTYEEDTSY